MLVVALVLISLEATVTCRFAVGMIEMFDRPFGHQMEVAGG